MNCSASTSEKQILCPSRAFTFSHSQGHKTTSPAAGLRSGFHPTTDIDQDRLDVRFSNRRFGVKRFHYPPLQCRCRSRARASLRNRHQGPSSMGFEDQAEQSKWRPCRLTDSRSKRTYELTSSIVPRGASFHRSVDLEFSPIALILCTPHAATVSLVQRNSVPSTQMRCMITANRRASATIAFFIPRRLAICIAQALSQDHFFERSMLCAAS
jgi:hypothetical protein